MRLLTVSAFALALALSAPVQAGEGCAHSKPSGVSAESATGDAPVQAACAQACAEAEAQGAGSCGCAHGKRAGEATASAAPAEGASSSAFSTDSSDVAATD